LSASTPPAMAALARRPDRWRSGSDGTPSILGRLRAAGEREVARQGAGPRRAMPRGARGGGGGAWGADLAGREGRKPSQLRVGGASFVLEPGGGGTLCREGRRAGQRMRTGARVAPGRARRRLARSRGPRRCPRHLSRPPFPIPPRPPAPRPSPSGFHPARDARPAPGRRIRRGRPPRARPRGAGRRRGLPRARRRRAQRDQVRGAARAAAPPAATPAACGRHHCRPAALQPAPTSRPGRPLPRMRAPATGSRAAAGRAGRSRPHARHPHAPPPPSPPSPPPPPAT
jgi:hypothetical protein